MSELKPTVREIYEIERAVAQQDKLETSFFHRIRLKNGVYKTTYSNRFTDVFECLAKHLPKNQHLDVMDVAISAGISTYELSQALTSLNIEHKMHASDISLYGTLYPVTKYLDILLDSNQYPLQFDFLGRSIPSSSSSLMPSAIQLVARTGSSILLKIIKLLHLSRIINVGNPHGFHTKKITLVTKRLLNNPDFILHEENILTPTPKELLNTFNILRAANILNLSYFDEKTLASMILNLKSRLKTNGLFVICRTSETKTGSNNGTIFKKLDNGELEVIDRVGAGSEIEDIVLRTNRL